MSRASSSTRLGGGGFGRLDIVVANAGVLNWGRLWEISPQQWQETLDTNLTGVWHTIQAAAPPIVEAGNGGSIITISSAAGIKAVPGCGHLLRQFGVVGLTSSLAVELEVAVGIQVNSVPYGTDTRWAMTWPWPRCSRITRPTSAATPRAPCRQFVAAPDLISDTHRAVAGRRRRLAGPRLRSADKGYLKI